MSHDTWVALSRSELLEIVLIGTPDKMQLILYTSKLGVRLA